MTVTEDLLAANKRFAENFEQRERPGSPAKRLAVLTCMDARMHPEQFLGLGIGDAHVIRNAGGRASSDAIRSLIISSWLLGTTQYLVIHHTDCGMLKHTNQELHEKLREETGADASDIDFLPFSDLEQSVYDDIELIRSSSLIPADVAIHGFIYDVHTGSLSPVSGAYGPRDGKT